MMADEYAEKINQKRVVDIFAHLLGCMFAVEVAMTAIYLLGDDLTLAVLWALGAILSLELAAYVRGLELER